MKKAGFPWMGPDGIIRAMGPDGKVKFLNK